jgi:hypothetical protein
MRMGTCTTSSPGYPLECKLDALRNNARRWHKRDERFFPFFVKFTGALDGLISRVFYFIFYVFSRIFVPVFATVILVPTSRTNLDLTESFGTGTNVYCTTSSRT